MDKEKVILRAMFVLEERKMLGENDRVMFLDLALQELHEALGGSTCIACDGEAYRQSGKCNEHDKEAK